MAKQQDKTYQVRRVGSGEDIKDEVQAKSREEAKEKVENDYSKSLPWHVRKTIARPVK